jgi:hypothetical protein
MAAKEADGLPLSRTQQAGIDKGAGQLMADRFMQERRRDRRVDAARKASDEIRLAEPRRMLAAAKQPWRDNCRFCPTAH